MNPPYAWNDKSLLDQEPLRTFLFLRGVQRAMDTRRVLMSIPLGSSSLERVVNSWAIVAFAHCPSTCKYLSESSDLAQPLSDDLLNVFCEVYILLSEGRDAAAKRIWSRACLRIDQLFTISQTNEETGHTDEEKEVRRKRRRKNRLGPRRSSIESEEKDAETTQSLDLKGVGTDVSSDPRVVHTSIRVHQIEATPNKIVGHAFEEEDAPSANGVQIELSSVLGTLPPPYNQKIATASLFPASDDVLHSGAPNPSYYDNNFERLSSYSSCDSSVRTAGAEFSISGTSTLANSSTEAEDVRKRKLGESGPLSKKSLCASALDDCGIYESSPVTSTSSSTSARGRRGRGRGQAFGSETSVRRGRGRGRGRGGRGRCSNQFDPVSSSDDYSVESFSRESLENASEGMPSCKINAAAGNIIQDWTEEPVDDIDDSHLPEVVDEKVAQGQEMILVVEDKVQLPKPALPLGVRPLIWAESRQALCETFDKFRAYQSGVYHRGGKTLGYLLSAFSSAMDIFHHDGKFIVSHGGGKSKIVQLPNSQSVMAVAFDQVSKDKSVRALLNNFERQEPIVLLMDDKYRLFPYDMGKMTYSVLGYYWIVDAWAERERSSNSRGYCVKYKFAFQWCEGQGEPWWVRKEGEAKVTQACATVQRRSQVCDACQFCSPVVFRWGWTCLQSECSRFWQFTENAIGPPEYDAGFIQLRSNPDFCGFSWDLRPPRPRLVKKVATSSHCARGWWCDRCGRLCCREKWEHWHCSCGAILRIEGTLHTHTQFWPQEKSLNYTHYDIKNGVAIHRESRLWEVNGKQGLVLTFKMPDNAGKIHLITGNPRANERADEMFVEYQKVAANTSFFRRYPLQSHLLRGSMLVNYFSQNSGAPYKYSAGTNNTVPFEEAQPVVLNAKELIEERANAVLDQKVSFNEVLTAAYMEKQKMSYHSDSEVGLGPTVASLSLGSIAFMYFRMRARYRAPESNNQRDLTLVLRHGDVMVMEGSDIQLKYEHSVEPKNFRIAATARCIGQPNLARG